MVEIHNYEGLLKPGGKGAIATQNFGKNKTKPFSFNMPWITILSSNFYTFLQLCFPNNTHGSCKTQKQMKQAKFNKRV